MDLRRLRPADWLTGVSGLALLVLLWAPWYATAGGSLTAWRALTVVDWWLALTALLTLAVPLVTASRDSPAVPVALDVVCGAVTAVALLLVVVRLLWLPGGDGVTGRDWGVVAGAVATLAACAGSWWAVRDESAPGMRPAPAPERMPVPPAGAGPEPVARET